MKVCDILFICNVYELYMCFLKQARKSLSEDVEYVTYHKPLPLLLHGYVWPFILAYMLVTCGWVWFNGSWEQIEALFICCAIIAAFNIIACLFCVWSVHIRCKLTCFKVHTCSSSTPCTSYASLSLQYSKTWLT